MKYCLDCGQLQGSFPISEESIDDMFEYNRLGYDGLDEKEDEDGSSEVS